MFSNHSLDLIGIVGRVSSIRQGWYVLPCIYSALLLTQSHPLFPLTPIELSTNRFINRLLVFSLLSLTTLLSPFPPFSLCYFLSNCIDVSVMTLTLSNGTFICSSAFLILDNENLLSRYSVSPPTSAVLLKTIIIYRLFLL